MSATIIMLCCHLHILLVLCDYINKSSDKNRWNSQYFFVKKVPDKFKKEIYLGADKHTCPIMLFLSTPPPFSLPLYPLIPGDELDSVTCFGL